MATIPPERAAGAAQVESTWKSRPMRGDQELGVPEKLREEFPEAFEKIAAFAAETAVQGRLILSEHGSLRSGSFASFFQLLSFERICTWTSGLGGGIRASLIANDNRECVAAYASHLGLRQEFSLFVTADHVVCFVRWGKTSTSIYLDGIRVLTTDRSLGRTITFQREGKDAYVYKRSWWSFLGATLAPPNSPPMKLSSYWPESGTLSRELTAWLGQASEQERIVVVASLVWKDCLDNLQF